VPFSQPPACAFDQPSGPACGPNLRLSSAAVSSGAAFRPTCDLRRLPTFPPCLPINLRLASPIDLPAFPSDPTSDFHRLLHLRLCLPANLRLAPPINLPASPSDPSPAFAFDRPSGSAFQPCFRLASSAWPSSLTLNSTSVSSGAASFGAALRSTSSLRLRSAFRPCLRTQPPTPRSLHLRPNLLTDLRLASPISLPAPIHSTFGLRLRSNFGCLPIDLPLSLRIDLPAPPSDQPFGFRLRSTFRLPPSNSTSD